MIRQAWIEPLETTLGYTSGQDAVFMSCIGLVLSWKSRTHNIWWILPISAVKPEPSAMPLHGERIDGMAKQSPRRAWIFNICREKWV